MHLHYLVIIAIVIFIVASPATVFAHTARDSATSTSRTLRTRYTLDEERTGTGISVSTSEKLTTLLKSSKVTDQQLRKWLQKGKSADDVFYRMKLAKTDTWIFSNPLFSKWIQYADDLSATASGKGTSAISTLTAQYGDDKLYNMLKMGERHSDSKELASRLRADQVERWVKIRKDPSEVYKIYELNHAGGRLLRNPQFSSWAKYVDDLNSKKEGAVSMIPTLRKFYSDADLFTMVEAAKSVDDLKSMGLKLENSFVQFWINDKQTPVKVLAELQLEATTKTLESPLFSLLAKYTDVYNVKFPQTKTTMIETFTKTFGDEKVAKMLAAVKANDWKAKKIATELEAAQLQMWMRSWKSVDDVYNLLDLPTRQLVNDLHTNPLFNTWITYMRTFSAKNPDKMPQLLSTMAMQFTDRPMMQILQAVEKFPSMGSIAASLQLRKAENIFTTGISPFRAFRLTSLDTVGDSVLSSPLFTKWMSYVDDFNRKNPTKEVSWFLPLRANYEVNKVIETARKNPKTLKIADMVESEQMKEWLTMQKPPKYVFHFLNLDQAGDKTFSSPDFKLWVKYLDDFNQKYPAEKTSMIESIRANYKDILLMPILHEAAKIPKTEKLAKNLQNALTDKWVDEKVTVEKLKGMFGHMPSSNTWIEQYSEKLNKLS
ncbi:hypothetical protein P3T76_005375 [Phytophthora citrophthora]|uniref:RxLR effector PexRD54 WY domain-containing protein n=1 Tax=Phytophthora citrophthora TaxID=4793 RepID=A0AAD9GS30_9STRA|nr:hypothetical protein P3T76_005375 [Phytophthora citrophthora]